jgi:uncharacterized protein (TIGR01777 family)
MAEVFIKESEFPISQKELFQWHQSTQAFERLTPPWDHVEVIHKDQGIDHGKKVKLKVKIAGIPQTLEVIHQNYIENEQFEDQQLKGPFKSWVHTHKMQKISENQSRLRDEIHYELPLGPLGKIFGGSMARQRLDELFAYRHRLLQHDSRWKAYTQSQGVSPKKIIISGASGLIGKNLSAFLEGQGHEVWRFSRNPNDQQKDKTLIWDREVPSLKTFDWVIHLAGENVAQSWTESAKEKIRSSRIDRTQQLCQKLAQEAREGQVLFCASAIGYYGSQGDQPLDESHSLGQGFLADVCDQWEKATQVAGLKQRVILGRIGIVISGAGGAIPKLLLPFSMGVGGNIGLGKRWMSWIEINDVIGAIYFSLLNPQVSGPINLVRQAVSNAEFTKALGTVLHRPTIVPIPPMVLKAIYGEMAEETILASQRVEATKLRDLGFEYEFNDLTDALKFQLGRIIS